MRNINTSFRIDTLLNGEVLTNTHIISYSVDNTCIVIDPANGKDISKFLDEHEMKVKFIVNTHGHYDHISGNRFLKEKYNPLICIGAADAEYLTEPSLNMSEFLGTPYISPRSDIVLRNNDYLEIGENKFFIKETPGHTPGSITLNLDSLFFSGDLIFVEGLGRTDMPGGNAMQLISSVRTFWNNLKMDSMIYPGHGECGKKLLFENSVKEIFLYRY